MSDNVDIITGPAVDENNLANSGDERYAGPGWDYSTRIDDLQALLKPGGEGLLHYATPDATDSRSVREHVDSSEYHVSKTYIDESDALYLPLAGGTMTGNLLMGANGIGNNASVLTFDVAGNATFSGFLTISGGAGAFGVPDTTPGVLSLYGGAGGAAIGGQVSFHTSASHDAVINAYVLYANEDDLRISQQATVKLTLQGSDGTWLFGAAVGMGGNSITGLSTTGQVQFTATEYLASASSISSLRGASYWRVGSGTTAEGLGADGDFLVSGKHEVAGNSYLSNVVYLTTSIGGAVSIQLRENSVAVGSIFAADFTKEQVVSQLTVDVGRQYIFAAYGTGRDFDHAVQTNPTLYVHSATDPNSDNTQWWSVTHNQTNAVMTVGAGDLDIACPAQKTLELQTSVWDDINFGAGQSQKPASSIPTATTFIDNAAGDTDIPTDGYAVGDKKGFTTELLHKAKTGADLKFHIHFQCDDAPTGNDYVKWQIDYTVTRDGATCAATTPIVIEVLVDTQYGQERGEFPTIDGSGFLVGDQVKAKLSRVIAAGAEYTGLAKIVTLGIHVEIDTMGSRQEYAK